MDNERKELERVREIQELYGINEAETVLMLQFLSLVTTLGWSKKLTLKIIQATAALIEIVIDEEKYK